MSYIRKSTEFINIANELINSKKNFNTAVSRLYYGIFLREVDFLFSINCIEMNQKLEHGKIPARLNESIKNYDFFDRKEFSLFWRNHNLLYNNRKIADYHYQDIDNYQLQESQKLSNDIINYLSKIEKEV